jgi:hypothetical protein
MTEITTDCPVCEKTITITSRDIKLAVQHKADTGGEVLVTCSECCRALRMPPDMPQGGDLDEWISKVSTDEDWNGCIPMLDPTQEAIPAGSYSDLGVTFYRPGSGGTPMKKRPYMFTYGINPECHMGKNPNMGGKPVELGKKKR